MTMRAIASTEELRAASIVDIMQYVTLHEEHQCAKERRAVYRAHAQLHIGQGERVVIRNNLPQYHQAYCCGPYARPYEYLLGLIHGLLCAIYHHIHISDDSLAYLFVNTLGE